MCLQLNNGPNELSSTGPPPNPSSNEQRMERERAPQNNAGAASHADAGRRERRPCQGREWAEGGSRGAGRSRPQRHMASEQLPIIAPRCPVW